MKYKCALISVKDMAVSRKFYEELFGLSAELDFGANVMFECGLALQQGFAGLTGLPADAVKYNSNNFELYFEEEDIDGFVGRLKEHGGIRFLHDIKEHGWGQRVVRFYDPDMHIVEVAEPMEYVIKRFLAQGLSVEDTAFRTQFPVGFVQNCKGCL